MALLILQKSKSEEEKEQAFGAIVYAAQNGYQPAINFIEKLKAKQSN